MFITEGRFIKIYDLAAGAEAATQHCVFETNMMNGFAKGLNAAMAILNAESDEAAAEIAAKYRQSLANLSGTNQEDWRIGEIVPDENWVVK